MQILVNDKEIVSNYPKNDPNNEEKQYDFFESENMKALSTAEEKEDYLKKVDEQLYTLKLDLYELPSLVLKVIKSMKKNGVVEVVTTKLEKLKTNFPNEIMGFDQHA